MEMRKLGNSDLYTAPVVMGGNVFGWTIDEKQSFAVLDEFTGLGFNAVDTADVYSRWGRGNEGGESETIIGKWMKERGNRGNILLISKVGYDMGEGKNISRKYILKQVDSSLKRLRTDHIDLYFTHQDDDVTPVEETLSAHEELIKAGKVRWIGASNLSPERLRESLAASAAKGLPRYEVFQPEYNLYDRQGFEEGVGPVCKEHGLGVIVYFALARGFLTGKYRSEADLGKSVRGRGIKDYLGERGMRILRALDETAEKHGVSQAAVSLAWLMAKPPVTAPIASATRTDHLKSFTEAAGLRLDSEDMSRLDEASAY
ncbi:MAG TPA: aldo/keto reductase [Thermodesulfobacteriota bacterium]|nr:aldo/keto reductase [Thermodesulfobacteriota bacterium]